MYCSDLITYTGCVLEVPVIIRLGPGFVDSRVVTIRLYWYTHLDKDVVDEVDTVVELSGLFAYHIPAVSVAICSAQRHRA